jgi:hypothetical protein
VYELQALIKGDFPHCCSRIAAWVCLHLYNWKKFTIASILMKAQNQERYGWIDRVCLVVYSSRLGGSTHGSFCINLHSVIAIFFSCKSSCKRSREGVLKVNKKRETKKIIKENMGNDPEKITNNLCALLGRERRTTRLSCSVGHRFNHR